METPLRYAALVLLAPLALTLPPMARAAVLTPAAPLVGENFGSAFFGQAVAAGPDVVAIGAPEATTSVRKSGVVTLYDAVTGARRMTIANPTATDGDRFGGSLALSGARLLVSASGDDAGLRNTGAAYLFDTATGALASTLRVLGSRTEDRFGAAVALSPGYALVSAPGLDAGSIGNSGGAYLFDAATGLLRHTFVNPTPASQDGTGTTVALSDAYVAMGAPLDDAGERNAGAVHVFDTVGGAFLRTIANPFAAAADEFGSSLAIGDDYLLIGAKGDDTGATNSGAAYLYSLATGTLLQTFLNPDPASSDGFGSAVSLFGDLALIGAPFDDSGATNAGTAYLFDLISGQLLETYVNPNPGANDRWGFALSLGNGAAVISAYLDDAAGTNSGAAVLYDAPRRAVDPVPPPPPIAVPLPASLPLLACALFLLLPRRRRA